MRHINWRISLNFKWGRQLDWLQHVVMLIQLTPMCNFEEEASIDLASQCNVNFFNSK